MVTKSYCTHSCIVSGKCEKNCLNRYQVHERSENYGGIGFET